MKVGDVVIRVKNFNYWEKIVENPYTPKVITRMLKSDGGYHNMQYGECHNIQLSDYPGVWWGVENFLLYQPETTDLKDFL